MTTISRVTDALNDYDLDRAIQASGVVDSLIETEQFAIAVREVIRDAL